MGRIDGPIAPIAFFTAVQPSLLTTHEFEQTHTWKPTAQLCFARFHGNEEIFHATACSIRIGGKIGNGMAGDGLEESELVGRWSVIRSD